MLLGAVVQVFEDFRYTDQTETGDTATLAFSARVGDRELDGIDLLRFDDDGQDPRDGGLRAADERRQRPRRGDEAEARGARAPRAQAPPAQVASWSRRVASWALQRAA